MTQWPKNESAKGKALYQGSSSYNESDMARMEREDKKRSDQEALKLILHSAREASRVHWTSSNLALIEQICERQLGLESSPDTNPDRDVGQLIHG